MPTPFTHLDIAGQIRVHAGLDAAARLLVNNHWPAFCLGNVAPDYQILCDVPRELTHFYTLPLGRQGPAHERMLAQYRALADPARLTADRALFIAGYQAHLLLDVRWLQRILGPFFIQARAWEADWREKFLLHNLLLTLVDARSVAVLPAGMDRVLGAARPRNWLPFAADKDLIAWRDVLAQQLQPGATVATATIYAERMGMSADDFIARLNDDSWLQKHLFSRVPRPVAEQLLVEAVVESVSLVNDYLRPLATSPETVTLLSQARS